MNRKRLNIQKEKGCAECAECVHMEATYDEGDSGWAAVKAKGRDMGASARGGGAQRPRGTQCSEG